MQESEISAARQVIGRNVPESGIAEGKVVLQGMPAVDGRDVFEVSVTEGILTVKGSSLVAPADLQKVKAVRFVYTQGDHRLDVRNVRVMSDGKVLSRDSHEGYAGKPSYQTLYSLAVPKGSRASNRWLHQR